MKTAKVMKSKEISYSVELGPYPAEMQGKKHRNRIKMSSKMTS